MNGLEQVLKDLSDINLATDPEIVKKAVENIITEYKKLK